ncbi:Sirohydrochlorin ferrochelatase [Evansella caseinilytica]|uniref:Sirohydrochlorin ferrochelatase n=1 Tax=Evansella caseinilytica TaxID=1503961 RepID=A0A1H3RXZ9_9BACI|nr:CbiX/SirB N-terminal domain-containing protein [Evansella caseinilytica]SDZ30606.1 Sirohydrochlorin ferrochelatase [Evansella caseinilytica]
MTSIEKGIGILVIAHGSNDRKWVQMIEEAVQRVDTNFPLVIGYLELVEGKSIAAGVSLLEKMHVKKILAVPLFVCSGSTHLEEIKYALGVIDEPRLETSLQRINTDADIIWGEAMDAHPLIVNIVVERARRLSVAPENEVLLLTAHGSEHPGFHEVWEDTLQKLTCSIKKALHFSEVFYGTLHPDTLLVKAQEAIASKKQLVVVPVFLSEGYFTSAVIPEKLKGIPYQWSGDTHLPHPLISRWMQEVIQKYV